MKIPAAERNEFTESIGIPVIKTVEQVPGASVTPIPIRMPPITAFIQLFVVLGNRRINSLLPSAAIRDPTIIPMLTINAKRNLFPSPNCPIIGKKLLPPIQNLAIEKYIKTFNNAKQATQKRGFLNKGLINVNS
jgi:hypothetical protein